MKPSFAAIYKDYSGEKLYFTNDALYCKKSDEVNKVKYEDLLNALYFEKKKKDEDGKRIFSRNVTLYDKNKEVVFETSNAEKNLADIFNNIISLITGKNIKTEVSKEKDILFSLLEKWDKIFQSENLIIDPKKFDDSIDYVSEELRLNRYKKENIDMQKKLSAKTMKITRYAADKIVLEIGAQINNVKYIHYNQNMESHFCTSEITDYFVRYYPDNNNKDAYLLFCFDVEDWDTESTPSGFLRLEFKNGEMELKYEEVLAPSDAGNANTLTFALGIAGSTSYSERNTGLEKLLSKIGKKEVAKHLFSFIEHPYTLSPEEQKNKK